jgi:hypothetical protein
MSTSNNSHSNKTSDRIIVCPNCFRNNVSTNILCDQCKRVLPNTVVEVESRAFNSKKMVDQKQTNSKRNFKASLGTLWKFALVSGILIFGGVTYFSTQKEAKQQELARVEREAKTKAVVTARNLEQFVGQHYLQVQEMSASPFLSDRRLWSAWSTERKKEYFQDNYMANSDGMDSYVVIDAKTGDTVFSGGTGTKTKNNRDLDYYQEVIKFKKPVVVPRRKSTKTGIAYMYMAAPSFDERGQLMFVTRTRIRFEEFERQISASIDDLDSITGDSAKPDFFLVDDIGRIIASEDPEDIDKHINTIFPAASFLRKNQNSSVEIENNSADSSSLIAYAPIVETRGLPELDWSLILKTKIAD